MGSTNSTNQLPVELMAEMFQFLELKQSAKLLEVSRSVFSISRSPHYLRRARLQKVRLSSSHESSGSQVSEDIFEEIYRELRDNGMYRQAGEFRGRALHLILEKEAEYKKLFLEKETEYMKAVIELSTEYEQMLANPQG